MSGLYIHIPYCHSKCSYCDFFSIPCINTMTQYTESLIKELSLRNEEIVIPLETIYIGGGTPSIMPINVLSKLVDGVKWYADLSVVKEFTIEANPEDVTDKWCKEIMRLGITRVSMGIQSFSDNQLQIIGRRHTSTDAVNAVATLRDNGLENISCDLIYGLPEQSFASWQESLNHLLEMNLPHFSAYLLSYEPGTRLYVQLQHGQIEEASEELVTQMYDYLIASARIEGYEHYEISNFAKAGHRAVHNSNYWLNRPYLGIGVSAHSFDGNVRRYNPNNIKEYISAVSTGSPCFIYDEETEQERHNDFIIIALRTAEGIDLSHYRQHWGESRYNRLMRTAEPFILSGKMSVSNNYLFITEKSMLVSDRIMVEFFED